MERAKRGDTEKVREFEYPGDETLRLERRTSGILRCG